MAVEVTVKQVIVVHRSGAIVQDICALLREPRYEHVELVLATPDARRFHLNFTLIPRGSWVPNVPEDDHDPD